MAVMWAFEDMVYGNPRLPGKGPPEAKRQTLCFLYFVFEMTDT
jgi:hypothetical protein